MWGSSLFMREAHIEMYSGAHKGSVPTGYAVGILRRVHTLWDEQAPPLRGAKVAGAQVYLLLLLKPHPAAKAAHSAG